MLRLIAIRAIHLVPVHLTHPLKGDDDACAGIARVNSALGVSFEMELAEHPRGE